MISDRDSAAQLVDANHILVAQGILDAFGHVSMRHPDRDDRFLLSRNQAPGLVAPSDIQEYGYDGTTADERPGYLERFLHAEIYRMRSDVHAIVHSHAASFIPFSVTSRPLYPIWHMAAFLREAAPVFEIRDAAGASSDLLIRDAALGEALAASIGPAPFALMRGHGAVIVGDSVPQAVFRSIYSSLNADALAAALALGEVTGLNNAEAAAADKANAGQIMRAWNVWRSQLH